MCSCLDGVTTVRLGAVGDARIAASGEAHLRSLCRWAQVTVDSCFFDDPMDVGNLISGSSAFSKSSLNIWKFSVLTVEARLGEF